MEDRYAGLDTNGGPGAESETAKRYQDKAQGINYGHGAVPDSMPSQKGSFDTSLPNESPEELVRDSGRAGKKVGDAYL